MNKRAAPSWRADAALLGNTVIWGSTFVLVKGSLGDVSPVVFLLLRFSLAASVLFAIYGRKLQKQSVWKGIVAGVFLFLGYLFQTTGLQYTTASKSAFYTSLSIPMVPLLAAAVFRKAPRRWEVFGVVVASAGMVLLTTEGSKIVWDKGSLLSLLCAVAFAGHIVAVGYFADRADFSTVAAVQVATAAVLAGMASRLGESPRLRLTASVVFAVCITALLATALAFTVQAWAQQHTTATRTALIYTLEPIWAWITSWLLTGETLSALAAVGGILILSGVLLVELKRQAAAEHPNVRAVSPEV